MLTCFTQPGSAPIPLIPLLTSEFPQWLANETLAVQNWVKLVKFSAKPESFCLVPGAEGTLEKVLVGLTSPEDFWPFGALATNLPTGHYMLMPRLPGLDFDKVALAWGLGAYQFTRYKKLLKTLAQLVISPQQDFAQTTACIEAIYLVRDLINTPTEDMGPAELATAARGLAQQYGAQFSEIVGVELLQQNYPAIYTVGRASSREPRLIELRWGDAAAPKITLIGKGVCFDTGGLDIKSTAGMALMKKDMGGAAHVLGLAQMIMAAQLRLNLRVLIPAVENAISGNAYRPGDIITTRSGITVEITNTDAEGRLVLGDAITAAVAENPELIIDMATLTGAARIATGVELAAMFCNNDELANTLLAIANQAQDPLWRLPLYAPYRKLLDSTVADICNSASSSYAGAITAALYLQEFIVNEIPWLHFDIMAWNNVTRPGRPEGGEAMAIRALFNLLQARYS